MQWKRSMDRHQKEILTRLNSFEPYELYVLANLAANAANGANMCPVAVVCSDGDDSSTVVLAVAAILMLGGACDSDAAHALGTRLKACHPDDLSWLLILACDAFAEQGLDADAVSALDTELVPYPAASQAG
jgi:hypothetical protein